MHTIFYINQSRDNVNITQFEPMANEKTNIKNSTCESKTINKQESSVLSDENAFNVAQWVRNKEFAHFEGVKRKNTTYYIQIGQKQKIQIVLCLF